MIKTAIFENGKSVNQVSDKSFSVWQISKDGFMVKFDKTGIEMCTREVENNPVEAQKWVDSNAKDFSMDFNDPNINFNETTGEMTILSLRDIRS